MKPRKISPPEIPHWQLNDESAAQLDAVLSTLPRRNIFLNESVQVVLTGLLAGQMTWKFTPSCPVLLIVTFGRLQVETEKKIFIAEVGQTLTLNPSFAFRLSAMEHTDFLLIGGSQLAAVGKKGKRCLKCLLFHARN